jgi:hypothetical protein
VSASARARAHGSFGVSVPLRMVAGLLDVLLDVRFPSVRLTAAEGCSCPLESVYVRCTTAPNTTGCHRLGRTTFGRDGDGRCVQVDANLGH